MQPLTRDYHRHIKSLSRTEFESWLREYSRQVTKQNAIDYHFGLTLALRDKLGFGQKRIAEFVAKVDEVFKDLNGKVITHGDIGEVMHDEVKIVMEEPT